MKILFTSGVALNRIAQPTALHHLLGLNIQTYSDSAAPHLGTHLK